MNTSDKHLQENPSGQELPTEVNRNESYMAELNTRIARLAIALHVPLGSDDDVRAALHALAQDVADTERYTEPPDQPWHGPADGAHRRDQALRSELRGLLVMRYGAEQRLVEQLGVKATRSIMANTEARLQREGFQPGADGVNLTHLFDPK